MTPPIELASNDTAKQQHSFEKAVLPHLHAAYNLATRLTRNTQDAEDVVQEAYLRAFRFFAGFHGGNVRAWILKIVRNTCYTWFHKNRAEQNAAPFDEQVHSDTAETRDPETLLLRKTDGQSLKRALEELPATFREVFVLLELDGLSYRQIAEMQGIPVGTVMSRLARARHRLRESLTAHISARIEPEGPSTNRAHPQAQAEEEPLN